jgi:RHS repeat-associated protein
VLERSVSYGYDPVGNRTKVTESGTGVPPVQTSYAANNLNQYTSVAGSNLTYDANGNLTGHAGWVLSFDAQNRLTAMSNGGTNAVFYYDARNRCVKRTITKQGVVELYPTKVFYYDGWSLLEERDDAGNMLARYYHGAGIDELLARATPTGTVYYHQDALGSTVALTDGSGSVVESYRYDVYGSATVYDSSFIPQPSSLLGNRFLFTGREYLAELSLYDYRNRMYSQTLGRFLQVDPIRFDAQDVNLYRYAFNVPTSLADPSGEGIVDCAVLGAKLLAAKARLAKRVNERAAAIASGKCPDAGHDKAIEQAQRQVDRLQEQFDKHCKNDPSTYGELIGIVIIIGVGIGLAPITGGCSLAVCAI